MFICAHCGAQFEEPAYTLIPEPRLTLPEATRQIYMTKFCSEHHLEEYLQRIAFQSMRYVMTKVEGETEQQFAPGTPKELLLSLSSVGSH